MIEIVELLVKLYGIDIDTWEKYIEILAHCKTLNKNASDEDVLIYLENEFNLIEGVIYDRN